MQKSDSENNTKQLSEVKDVKQQQAVLNSARNFKLLNFSTVSKSITLLADITLSQSSTDQNNGKDSKLDEPDDKRARLDADFSRGIFIVEKVPLDQSSVELLIRHTSSEQLQQIFMNDIYSALLLKQSFLPTNSSGETKIDETSSQKTPSPDVFIFQAFNLFINLIIF